MKNIKKVLLIVALLGVFLVGGLFAGAKFGASTSWNNEVLSLANTAIGGTGYQKKEELIDKDITGEMKKMLDPKIAEEQAALEKMMEDYYQMKLDGLADTPEFAELESRIAGIKVDIFNRYKSDIDAIFNVQ